MKIQEREMRNTGTEINYIDANNVLFDGLKPPDTFLDLKSELIFGSFVSVKAHIDLTHSQKKSRNVGSNTAQKVSKYGVFWPVCSCIWTKYEDLLCKSPY